MFFFPANSQKLTFNQLYSAIPCLFSQLTVRAQLGAKSEKLLKKGKSVSDMLLVDILVNAIKYVLLFISL